MKAIIVISILAVVVADVSWCFYKAFTSQKISSIWDSNCNLCNIGQSVETQARNKIF